MMKQRYDNAKGRFKHQFVSVGFGFACVYISFVFEPIVRMNTTENLLIIPIGVAGPYRKTGNEEGPDR
jgi:hypothetical protein